METWPDTALIALLVILGVIALMDVIGVVTGWRRLGKSYRAHRPFSGKKFYTCSARLRAGGGYASVLTVGADPEGMYVSVPIVFGLGHPDLFIPWKDISAEAKRVWWVNVVILRFTRCPSIPFWISRKLADKLEMASGVQFITEEEHDGD